MSGLGNRTRWAVEGLVILVSILLAFWIDAWWDGVQARHHEAVVVEAARQELETNREIRRFVDGSSAITDRIERFLNATVEEVRATPADSVELLVEALWLPPTYDPPMAAVTVLLETPPLPTEESLHTHRLVSAWTQRLEDAKEEAGDLRSSSSRVVDLLVARAASLPRPPRFTPPSDWSGVQQNRTFVTSAIEQAGPEGLAQLRADDAFVAALARKLHDQKRYITEIARAARRLDSILAALPANSRP